MPLTDYTADHLATATNEPQRSNNALLFISGLPGQTDPAYMATAIDSFSAPKWTNSPIELAFLNEKRKVAGRPLVEDMTVTYKDFVDKNIAAVLMAWRLQVYNPFTGVMGYAGWYKKNALVYLYPPDFNTARVRKFALEGVWPQDFDMGEFTMEGEETVKITFPLSVDKVKPLPVDRNFFDAGRTPTGLLPGAAAAVA